MNILSFQDIKNAISQAEKGNSVSIEGVLHLEKSEVRRLTQIDPTFRSVEDFVNSQSAILPEDVLLHVKGKNSAILATPGTDDSVIGSGLCPWIFWDEFKVETPNHIFRFQGCNSPYVNPIVDGKTIFTEGWYL